MVHDLPFQVKVTRAHPQAGIADQCTNGESTLYPLDLSILVSIKTNRYGEFYALVYWVGLCT